jgi:hypothetical protein
MKIRITRERFELAFRRLYGREADRLMEFVAGAIFLFDMRNWVEPIGLHATSILI